MPGSLPIDLFVNLLTALSLSLSLSRSLFLSLSISPSVDDDYAILWHVNEKGAFVISASSLRLLCFLYLGDILNPVSFQARSS